jgi:hypothetical protein
MEWFFLVVVLVLLPSTVVQVVVLQLRQVLTQ